MAENMKPYAEMTRRELHLERERLESRFESVQNLNLDLDMSRGKPDPAQLNLSQGMMDVLNSKSRLVDEKGNDCRNYGILGGTPEAKRLMGEMSEVKPESMLIFGNSSLNVMFDMVSRSMTHGVCENDPWMHQDNVTFLCPVPGYDRHFRITEYFGIDMVNIPMSETGPDMDMVEELVNTDPTVKGIWCVPKYSNPQGYTYSEETVKRFANLTPAADDFRIYWDNAYSIHHLYDDPAEQDYLPEILAECEKAGHPDLVYKFISTSKVSFPGSGIAAVATSQTNLGDIKRHMRVQTIGHDKVNQLRHVRFFKNIDGLHEHMKKHAAILRPKFEMVEEMFEHKLGRLGIATWTKPKGGYFISFDAMEGTAKEIVAKCAEAGVKITAAGATFPYGIDPKDSNIRIAPSYPPLEELRAAAEVFTISVRLVTLNHMLRRPRQ